MEMLGDVPEDHRVVGGAGRHQLVDVHRADVEVEHVARLLRPGGVLLIAVPNFASPEARIGRAGWFHLDVPRHLVHLTPSTLRAILGSAGFRPVKVTHLVPEYDLFSFVQTAENRLGLPPNLLYDVLRRPEARLRRQPTGRVLTGVAVGLAVPLSIAAVVIAPLAAAARRSATIAVYAVRVPDQRE
jgi:SAM-dependent methyltransferase